jgi:hypothetical protein
LASREAPDHLERVESVPAFMLPVVTYDVMMARRMHCEPFERLQPAPQVFWDIWQKQAPEQVHLERVESVPAFMLPVVTYDEIPA